MGRRTLQSLQAPTFAGSLFPLFQQEASFQPSVLIPLVPSEMTAHRSKARLLSEHEVGVCVCLTPESLDAHSVSFNCRFLKKFVHFVYPTPSLLER